MKYLKAKQVRLLFHNYDKQITKTGLFALDKKVEDLMIRFCLEFNGHHKRIDEKIINLKKV